MPMRLAFDSKSPKIIETTLAAIQKLIAHGQLRGDADIPSSASAVGAAAGSAGAVVGGGGDQSPAAVVSASSQAAADAEDVTIPSASSAGDLATTAAGGIDTRTPAEVHAGEIIELACKASEILEESVSFRCSSVCSPLSAPRHSGYTVELYFASCARATTSSSVPSLR